MHSLLIEVGFYRMKWIRIGGRQSQIAGISETDVYFAGLHDGIADSFSSICEAFVPRDGVVMDVGANIGITAIALSRCAPSGTVYAFEPAPTVFSALAENVRLNQLANVRTFNLAVSDADGSVSFNENSAYGSIVEAGGISVPATTIDKFVADNDIQRLDFLKIDVEGFEQHVLCGAKSTTAKLNPTIQIELNGWTLAAHSKINIVDFLESIFADFRHIFIVGKGLDAAILTDITNDGGRRTAHRQMVGLGCVDDLIITNNEEHFHKLTRLCTPVHIATIAAAPVATAPSPVVDIVGWRQIAKLILKRLKHKARN